MKPLFFAFLIFSCLVFSKNSDALVGQRNPFESITSFEVASLFYKLSKATPNFSRWAEHTDAYKEAASFDKEIIKQQQEDILRKNFYNFNHEEPINIYFNLTLSHYSAIQNTFFFSEIHEETFFPYTYAGEDYAIFLAGIAQFGQVEMDREIAKKILNHTVKAEFLVVADKSDMTNPIPIYNRNLWSITGRVAEFKIWNSTKTTLYYSHKAEWYNPRNELLELYTGK